jgi:hypothetical protein
VALALSVAPLLALQGLDPRTARPGWRGWAAYGAVAVGLAAPWYAGMAAMEPPFVTYFFWKHNVVRYVAPFDHAKPTWFHVPGLLLGTLPWTLLLPGLVRWLVPTGRTPGAANRPPAALGFPLLAFLWCVAFYSLAGCKRPVYILPALPLLALMLGGYLDVLLPPKRAAGVRFLFPIARGGWKTICWSGCAVLTFLVLLGGVHHVLPHYARKFSLRPIVRPHGQCCAARNVPVVCYPRRWDSVSFYLRRDDVRVYTARQKGELIEQLRQAPDTLLIVKSERYLDDLLGQMPASLEFVPQGRQGTVTLGVVQARTKTLYAGLGQDRN